MNKFVKAAVDFSFKNTCRREVLIKRRCTTALSNDPVNPDVAGLSAKTVDVPTAEVGFPKASKKAIYKNPEYFCYHNTSYFEAEVEMMKYRLPQPSNKKS